MRKAAALLLLLAAGGCAGSASSSQKAKIAARDDLSAIQAIQRLAHNGKSGAPVSVVFISGTITNTGTAALHCNANAFLLVDPNGNAIAPAAQWCDSPSIAPQQSAFFNATFQPGGSTDNLQLRYVHPDGSYEVHDLILPPA